MPPSSIYGFGSVGPTQNKKLKGVYQRARRTSVYTHYRPVGVTCPSACKLLDPTIAAKRHAGHPGEADGGRAFRGAMRQAHIERPDVVGWGYTHAGEQPEVVEWSRTLPDNLVIVASADTEEHARRLLDLGWQHVALTVPTAAENGHFGRSEIKDARAIDIGAYALPCPAQHTPMGCADCGACFTARRPGTRPLLVVFGTHGKLVARARDAQRVGGCYMQGPWTAQKLDVRAGSEQADPVEWVRALPRSKPGRSTMIRWLVSGDLWSDWHAG